MASSANGNGSSLDPDLTALFGALERKLASGGERLTLRTWLDCAESWRILEALRQARGNRSAAARALGIGRRTLYTKMEKLGIQPSWGSSNGSGAVLRAADPP
jgi:DNA-binding NtrC family response regulator